MRIVVLEKFLANLLAEFDLLGEVVGISADCREYFSDQLPAIVTLEQESGLAAVDDLSTNVVNLPAILALNPDIVLTRLPMQSQHDPRIWIENLRTRLALPETLKIHHYGPQTLNDIYEMLESLGRRLKQPEKGRDIAQKIKAQLANWADNFYDRTKGKRVVLLTSLEPLRSAGLWFPEIIHTFSAHSQQSFPGEKHQVISWEAVRDFKPDVIIVAPEGLTLQESAASFKKLEAVPLWEDILAVKRGAVYFCDGLNHFYQPALNFRDSCALLLSCIAGLESGYITPRDSYYNYRWLQLQRHRIIK